MMVNSNRGRVAWGLLALGGAFCGLYADILIGLAHDWFRDDNYSHGALVLPVFAYFVWDRRIELRALPIESSRLGIGLVVVSLCTLLLGTAAVEYFLTRVSLIGVLAGLVIYLGGWRHFRLLAFPLAFLVAMIPLPALLFNQVAFPLQLLASKFGVAVLQLAQVPVLREGNLIILANTTLEVAEACSGIRSLISLLTVAVIYGYVVSTGTAGRMVLAAAAIPIAIGANGLRVAASGVAAHYYGPDIATGVLHSFSGWLLFVTSFALIVAVHSVSRRANWLHKALFRQQLMVS